MEKDESLLEKLLGLHEAIETLKSRRVKDPYASLSRRFSEDKKPVMDDGGDDVDVDADPGIPKWLDEDAVSICSAVQNEASKEV
jgi:hypothetical protein